MAPASAKPAAPAEHPIPWAYRVVLLYIEPILAFNGAVLLFFSPNTFLTTMSPRLAISPSSSPQSSFSSASTNSSSIYSPAEASANDLPFFTPEDALSAVRVLTDQLAIFELVFAFNLAVALRATSEPRLWRILCAGMLLSDVLHVLASARELSREGVLDPACWRPADWFNFAVLACVGFVRLLIVLGVGLGRSARRGRTEAGGPAAGGKAPYKDVGAKR